MKLSQRLKRINPAYWDDQAMDLALSLVVWMLALSALAVALLLRSATS